MAWVLPPWWLRLRWCREHSVRQRAPAARYLSARQRSGAAHIALDLGESESHRNSVHGCYDESAFRMWKADVKPRNHRRAIYRKLEEV
eukprot:633804-Prorocentrum_minimum.AAC.3